MENERIIKAIIEHYGEISDRGCYVNGKWLSIEKIVEIIRNQGEN